MERNGPGFKASFYVEPVLLVGALAIHALFDRRVTSAPVTLPSDSTRLG
jgi:hypothetical protein